jgi:hypothetical protein
VVSIKDGHAFMFGRMHWKAVRTWLFRVRSELMTMAHDFLLVLINGRFVRFRPKNGCSKPTVAVFRSTSDREGPNYTTVTGSLFHPVITGVWN